jgi:hypothetical protein
MFSALLTEFKKVLIQDPTTDFTVTGLHLFYVSSCSALIHWGRILKFRSGRYRNATHCVTDTRHACLPVGREHSHAIFFIYGANFVT